MPEISLPLGLCLDLRRRRRRRFDSFISTKSSAAPSTALLIAGYSKFLRLFSWCPIAKYLAPVQGESNGSNASARLVNPILSLSLFSAVSFPPIGHRSIERVREPLGRYSVSANFTLCPARADRLKRSHLTPSQLVGRGLFSFNLLPCNYDSKPFQADSRAPFHISAQREVTLSGDRGQRVIAL